MTAAVKKQRRPKKTDEVPVYWHVQSDLEYRAELGKEKYGDHLKPSNGRDHLVDAYQEALDLCCYLRAEIERRKR